MTKRKKGDNSVHNPDRRGALKKSLALGAAASVPNLFYINHAWSQDVAYDGEVFDAGGAVINIGEWGGGWEEFIRAAMVDDFEKDFNCKVN